MQFPHLFSPLEIGRVTVPNRISFSAHLTNLAAEGLPTERLKDYLTARARGGRGSSSPRSSRSTPPTGPTSI